MLNGSELPAAFAYVSPDDHLRLRVRNSAAACIVAIEGRLAARDGTVIPFADTLAPAVDRSASTKLVRLAEGLLINVSVRALSGAPRRGQTFVVVELVRGFTGDVIPLGVLVQGYVSDTTRRQWPGSLLEDSTDGRGWMRSIASADPAAGAEFSETVPTAARWRFHSLYATLVTDATAANRYPTLVFDDGANIVQRSVVASPTPASSTFMYTFAPYGSPMGTGSTSFAGVIPGDVNLPAAYRIRSITTGMVVGDNWGPPQLLVEEWIEP